MKCLICFLFAKIEYADAGTPISNTHYIGALKGEIYGADHGIQRFSPDLTATIRPQTPLKNLYLTGQFVMQAMAAQYKKNMMYAIPLLKITTR